MFSSNCLIELTFNYFIFFYYSFIKIQLNPYKFSYLLYYLFIKYWSLEFLKYISRYLFKPSLVNCWFFCIIFIGSAFIDHENCPWVWLKIISGPYPNHTYIFDSPTGLSKVVVRVLVLWLHLLKSIHWLASRKFLEFENKLVDSWWFIYKHHRGFFLLLVSRYINSIEDFSLGWGSIFINIVEDCYFGWSSRSIEIAEDCSFGRGSIFINITEYFPLVGIIDNCRSKRNQVPLG